MLTLLLGNWIAKQSAAQRGKKRSPEAIAKAPATREANGNMGRGVPKTPEHCAARQAVEIPLHFD